jgi:hypothetical protein
MEYAFAFVLLIQLVGFWLIHQEIRYVTKLVWKLEFDVAQFVLTRSRPLT